MHLLIQLLKVAPKHQGNVIVNRKGQQIKHIKISQHGSSFSPGGRIPKTCFASVVNAFSTYAVRFGKHYSCLQQAPTNHHNNIQVNILKEYNIFLLQ